jgi:peptidoglycan/xylan/chitin deacetylase (PgdA/CDA1 family)
MKVHLGGWTSPECLSTAMDRVGLPRAVLSVRRAASAWITVLTYRRVARRGAATPFDGAIDIEPEQFSRHLAFIKRWFNPIGIGELGAFARGRGRLPRNPIMVTFDEGYRDNHDIALPMLVKHGVRAVFFLATDYVQRRRIYWWDRVSLLVRRSRRERIVLHYPEPAVLSLESEGERRTAVARLQRVIRDRPGLDLDRFLAALERATDAGLSSDEERHIANATVMTWDHAAALQRAGMDVQSHTHTHRVLQTLEGPELERELRLSREALEDSLGERVLGLSYPVGKPLDDDGPIRKAVRDAGYELGFSNATGVNRTRALDALDVKRVSLDVSMGDPFFRSMLAIPWLGWAAH